MEQKTAMTAMTAMSPKHAASYLNSSSIACMSCTYSVSNAHSRFVMECTVLPTISVWKSPISDGAHRKPAPCSSAGSVVVVYVVMVVVPGDNTLQMTPCRRHGRHGRHPIARALVATCIFAMSYYILMRQPGNDAERDTRLRAEAMQSNTPQRDIEATESTFT